MERSEALPMHRHALVTGGAGFIGAHLCTRLCTDGWFVTIADNLSTGSRKAVAGLLESRQAELLECDIRNTDTLAPLFDRIGCVFHLAAEVSVARSMIHPDVCADVNVLAFVRLLHIAGKRRIPVVYASSSAVYGNRDDCSIAEDTPLRPTSPYGASKVAGEIFARVATTSSGVPTIGLRFFNVYGPGQNPDGEYAAVVPAFIRAALSRHSPRIYGNGLQTRDFVFVGDVVESLLESARRSAELAGDVFNVGSGRATSILELADITGSYAPLPRPSPVFLPPRPGDIRNSCADVGRMRSVLGTGIPTSLRDGIAETVSSFRRRATSF
jgi:UDP-glucose 4-epimerase